MNVPRALLSSIAGLSAALIVYSAVFVRGDLMGVMAYLRARAALRRLREGGASADQVTAAQGALHDLGVRIADPALAAQLIPLALLVGAVVALLVWRLFTRKAATDDRADVQERMVLRLAHRKGGVFTLDELVQSSPLTDEQARAVTARLLNLGQLAQEGAAYRLP